MIAWFEIPVTDMNRAKAFYEKVFDIEISIHDMDGLQMGWFPNKNQSGIATGSLVEAEGHYTLSENGVLVYFSCTDVSNEMSKVEDAGGKVVLDKKQISEEHGYMAYFIDSEGNRIALHSSN
ncbi:VOC family protein [Aquimarina algiphila]|uniref:VOC family protein n=1 Tax=Aquimarina algiphila TaxID=2047982 RepID=A0A554VM61_9FLAO|nr:VOC family protein [Aquimarina algiphila]TSE09282.1 VOC family protein [Aquimarina algiphila]